MSLRIRPLVISATLTALGTIAAGCTDIMPPEPRATAAADIATIGARVVVSPDSMHGWVFVDDQRSVACTDPVLCSLTLGPVVPPLGAGSAELAAPTSGVGTALVLSGYGGTRLDQITELSYSTYRQTPDGGNNLAVALQLTADFDLADGSNAWQGRLVFEPYHENSGQVVQSSWQTWNTKAGKWWGTRATVVRGGVSTANPCVQSAPCTWSQLLNIFPNAAIHATYGSLILKAGSGWSGFRGNVDALTLGTAGGTTSYDFELTAAPPVSTIPSWIFADSSMIDVVQPTLEGRFTKNVLAVDFDDSASPTDRTAAFNSISGTVVASSSYAVGPPTYYVAFETPGTGEALETRLQILDTMPHVTAAVPVAVVSDSLTLAWRKPHDDANLVRWVLHPDSVRIDPHWALEHIAAPMAWGCSVGDAQTRVAVIDNQIAPGTPDIHSSFLSPSSGTLFRGHGNRVASIMAAEGNNNSLMPGVMWNSDLYLYDVFGMAAAAGHPAVAADYTAAFIAAGSAGARVINVSLQWPQPSRSMSTRRAMALRFAKVFDGAIQRLRNAGHKPLFVFSAGNYGEEAGLSVFPLLVDSFPDQVIVVGSTQRYTPARGDSLRMDSDLGPRVEIAAPGENLLSLDASGNMNTAFAGTSGAAPYVSGVAGLLFSFDPSLTAQQVKEYLIRGAVRGGRSVFDVSTPSRPIPLLNAYESLRAAAERPEAPLCGNRIWVDDNGVPQVQRILNTDYPLAPGGPQVFGDYLFVPHDGKRVYYTTQTGEGFFQWNTALHRWMASSTDFWTLPDSVIENLYGRTRAQGWDHDRLLVTTIQNNGTGVDVYIGDTTRAGHSWKIGRTISRGSDAAVSFVRQRELAQRIVCYEEGGDPCGRQEVHVAADPYPEYGYTYSTYVPATDRAYGQAAFSMLGDSIYFTHQPVVETQALTDWEPCQNNPGFTDGLPYFSCHHPVSSYTYGTVTVQSLPASSELTANGNAQSNTLPWSTTAFTTGRAPIWMTTSESGQEFVIADAIRGSVAPFGGSYSDCRIRWIARATGTVLKSVSSDHSCTSRGVGTVAPKVATLGIVTGSAPIPKPRPVKTVWQGSRKSP